MPNPFKAPFAVKPRTVNINRGPYSMKMEDGENAEITMYGEVVETRPRHLWTGEPMEGDFIVQDEFLRDLDRLSNAKTVTIHMNSVGGDALVGMVIHNKLRELSAKGTRLICIVDGAAMSAASVIICACGEVRMNPASLVMIHRCWGFLWGGYNADELRETAEMYDAYDRAAVTAYQRKTGLSETELLRMMSETTWLTGKEAVEKGFADQLIEDAAPLDIAASADGRSLFVRGRQFHLTPGMFAPDIIPTVTPGAAAPAEADKHKPAQTGGQNGGTTMAKNLEELRAENPALAEALMAEAKAAVSASGAAAPVPAPAGTPAPTPQSNGGADPAQAERKRIQEIDALAGVFDAETINAAKYGDHPCTAQEMVYQAAQKAAQQGRKFLALLEADTKDSGAQDVGAANGAGGDGTGGEDTPQAMAAQAKADAKAFNERKKEVR